MLLQPKDPVLLVVGSKDMDPHRIPGMGFDDRRHWIFRLVHLAGLEHMTQVTSLLFPGLVRLIPVIHSGEPRHVLHVRHEARADDVVFVLEEQGRITIVRATLIPFDRPIHDHIGDPTVLL